MSLERKKLIKIAVVGPESTGKSTMAQHLAKRLNTICVPEYSRYYCANLQNQYVLQDELNMFYGQLALEDALTPLAKEQMLICDTTILTVKIWSDHLFQHTPNEVLEEIKTREYDLYLLMDIDLPWQDDPLRDFPDQREHFMNIWKDELTTLGANYSIISGLDEARMENAWNRIQEFLKNN